MVVPVALAKLTIPAVRLLAPKSTVPFPDASLPKLTVMPAPLGAKAVAAPLAVQLAAVPQSVGAPAAPPAQTVGIPASATLTALTIKLSDVDVVV